MGSRQRLAGNLRSESKAYGYTLTTWGAGVMLVQQFGTPAAVEVFGYVGGALLGFAVLTAFAFSRLLGDIDRDDSDQLVAVSMVHSFATAGNLLVSYLLVVAGDAVGVPAVGVFLVVGGQATVGYNVLLLLEDRVARTMAAATG